MQRQKKKSRRREWKPELLLLLELLQSTKTLDVFAVLLRRASVSFSFQANIGCVDFACFYASRCRGCRCWGCCHQCTYPYHFRKDIKKMGESNNKVWKKKMLFCFRVSASHFDPYVGVSRTEEEFLAWRYKKLRDERVVTLQMKCMEKLTIFSRRKTFVFFILSSSSLLLLLWLPSYRRRESLLGKSNLVRSTTVVVSVISNNSSKKEGAAP